MKYFTAKELSEALNEALEKQGQESISIRNIRYYREIGLLNDLAEKNNRKYFTQEHYDYLLAMKTLQKTGEPLEGIKAKLSILDQEQIQQVGNRLVYYSTDSVLSQTTRKVTEDVSVQFSNHVPKELQDRILSAIEEEMKKDKG